MTSSKGQGYKASLSENIDGSTCTSKITYKFTDAVMVTGMCKHSYVYVIIILRLKGLSEIAFEKSDMFSWLIKLKEYGNYSPLIRSDVTESDTHIIMPFLSRRRM